MEIKLSDYHDEFRKWNTLTEAERAFFVGDEYLPLSENHAARISIISGRLAREFSKQALLRVPGFPTAKDASYKEKEIIFLEDAWASDEGVEDVRRWLYQRGVPFSTSVYLLYDDLVVKTDWKTVVNYWDAFAYNVGVEMLALDSTKTWVCSFHHEDVITFYHY